MNFEKGMEDFLQNIPIHNNLFYFSHNCYVLGEKKPVYRPFFMFSKKLLKPSNSKNCFKQMEFNFTKMREFCIPNRPIVKKLLQFLHSNHTLGEFKISSQVIFLEIYNFII